MSSFLFWLKLFTGLTVAVGAIFLIAFNEQEIGNFLAETKGGLQGFFKNSSQELATSPEITEYFEEETETEEEPLETENININHSPNQPSLEEIQEELDDILEKTDILVQEVQTLEQEATKKDAEEIAKIEAAKGEPRPEGQEEKENKEEERPDEPGQDDTGEKITLCERKEGDNPLQNKVIFNEIGWMGTVNSANDEWVELKDIINSEVNLSGWQIVNKEQKIKIIFSDKNYRGATPVILPGGFVLLERTSEETLPGMPADSIYTGALRNSDEALYLFDENCRLQDEILANPNWQAGDNASKRTMERKNDLGWQTSVDPGGTPKRENSSGYIVAPVIPGGGSGGGGVPSPTPTPFSKILISEIQIEGETVKDDFIEFYNPNDFDVELKNYRLVKRAKDSDKDTTIKSWAKEEVKISTKQYYLWASLTDENSPLLVSADSQTKQNISPDNGIALRYGPEDTGEIIDALGWGDFSNVLIERFPFPENPGKNKSLGRKWDEIKQEYQDTDNNSQDFEIQEPSPKAKNQSPQPILEVFPESLSFSIVEFTTPSQSQTININNTGEGILNWTGIIEYATPSETNWLRINPDSGIAPSQISVSADVSNLAAGNYFAKIIITAEGAQKSPKEVEVGLNFEEVILDTTPPEVIFNLEPIQTYPSFKISFEITDSVLDTATPSGLDGFVFRWKEEGGDWQEDQYQKIEGAPFVYVGEKEFSGEDGKTYYFQIKARDVAGNESDWQPEPAVSTQISLPKTILINEI